MISRRVRRIKTKNNKRKRIKNNKRTNKRRYRGGAWSFSNFFRSSTENPPQDKKSKVDSISDLNALTKEGLASKVANNIETPIYAIGIGISTVVTLGLLATPLGPGLSAGIIIVSILTRYYVRNLRLIKVLNDTMIILTKGSSLYDLIIFSDKTMNEQCTPGNMQNCFEINDKIVDALSNNLDSLTELLLSIMPKEGLEFAIKAFESLNDQNDQNPKFTNLKTRALYQIETRKKFNLAVLTRMYSRFFDSAEIRIQIISDITMINGYFIIIYTQYKLIADSYSVLYPEQYKTAMEKIIKSNVYKSYLKPKTTEEVVNAITENSNISGQPIPTNENPMHDIKPLSRNSSIDLVQTNKKSIDTKPFSRNSSVDSVDSIGSIDSVDSVDSVYSDEGG